MQPDQIYASLVKRIREYHPSPDLAMVERAYEVALKGHGSQLRKSGEPYIIHPLSVAYILADLELDVESVTSGILHDIIEDTKYTYEDILGLFDREIADIVDGVTKLDRIEDSMFRTGLMPDKNQAGHNQQTRQVQQIWQARGKGRVDHEELQAENYRKMFLAMAKDIRVILIKIADRLHNLRTLMYLSPEKQREKAQETLDIYSPLAHRLGISKICREMEDISFRYTKPEEYDELMDKLGLKQSERIEYINNVVDHLKGKLSEVGVHATVDGRPKHLFSIYKKMKNKDKTLDQIFDLFAVRVIVDEVRDCYEVLGHVHEMYRPMPARFKDYIAMPKPNMYQSLHTVVIGPQGEPMEIQIRTLEMHRTAEYGIAAHWRYKEGAKGSAAEQATSEEAKLTWLRQILDWQRDLSDNKEFLDALKVDLDIYADDVYCFSPRGDIINLAKGSTPIDFAYAIHSAVGNKMIGARVNGDMVPFGYQLANGDRVEIITSQNSRGPSRDWLKLVKTSQARSKINQWFKRENKEVNTQRGREYLEKEAKRKGYNLSDLLTPQRRASLLERFTFPDWDTLCAAVGFGGLKEGHVVNKLIEQEMLERPKELPNVISSIPGMEAALQKADEAQRKPGKNSGIFVEGVGDISVRFSKCCSPVPGDEIVGFITRGRGVSIHRTDCVNIINLDELERHRIIEAQWRRPDKSVEAITYRAEIKIVGDDRLGLLADISKILSDEKAPVVNMNVRTPSGEAIINVAIEISSRVQLDRISGKIMRLNGVHDIERVTT